MTAKGRSDGCFYCKMPDGEHETKVEFVRNATEEDVANFGLAAVGETGDGG